MPIVTGEKQERKRGTGPAAWIAAPLVLFLAAALVLPGFRTVRFQTGKSAWMIRSRWEDGVNGFQGFHRGQILAPNGLPGSTSYCWSLYLGDWSYEVWRFE